MINTKIIGVPLHYGANKCGIEYGLENFYEYYSEYKNTIEIIPVEIQKEDFKNKNLKFLNTISTACNKLAKKVESTVKSGDLPIITGGDHAIALGSIAGVSKTRELGVIWVDAHGDFNTHETSETGHIHGMPLAASLGFGDKKLVDCHYEGNKLKAENVVLFGQRSIDELEEELMIEAGVRCYKWSEITERGFEVCLKEASDILRSRGLDVHISFDLDAIDPTEVTGVSTPVIGGLSRAEGLSLIDFMFRRHHITSIDIVEYNPIFEKHDDTAEYIDQLIKRVKYNLELKSNKVKHPA